MRLNQSSLKVPKHWKLVPLKRITRFSYGEAIAAENRDENGQFSVFGSNGAFDRHSAANTRGPCIIVGRKGSHGKIQFSDEPVFAVDTTFIVDQRHTSNDLRYLYFALGVLGLDELSDDTAVPGLSREKAYAALCPLPPLDTQKRIAAFLDEKTARIDALIAKKHALLERLAEKRQAIITQAVTKGLNPAAPMKDSGIEWLGEIPAHWEVKRLRFISPKQSVGVVVNPSNYIDETGTRPFIYGANIREFEIDWQSARRLTDEPKPELNKSELHEGDVLVVRVGEPGVAAVVDAQGEGSNCASVMFVRKGNFCSSWLAYVMNSTAGRSEVSRVAYGAAQKQFNIEHAFYFRYPTPPTKEQETIALRLDTVRQEIRNIVDKIGENIEKLTEYRSALITAAVIGQIEGLR